MNIPDYPINALDLLVFLLPNPLPLRVSLAQETLYAKMLQRWEAKMGLELVRDSLSLLCISRQGLSLQELEEILKISER